MTTKLDAYNISGRITCIADITIKAESYEDALERANHLSVTDFIKFKGSYVDGNLIVGSISKDNYWDIDE